MADNQGYTFSYKWNCCSSSCC